VIHAVQADHVRDISANRVTISCEPNGLQRQDTENNLGVITLSNL
jgi:hypothetical protein